MYHRPHLDEVEGEIGINELRRRGIDLDELIDPFNMTRAEQQTGEALFSLSYLNSSSTDQDLVQLAGQDFQTALIVINLEELKAHPEEEIRRVKEALGLLRFYARTTSAFCFGQLSPGTQVRRGDYPALSTKLESLLAQFPFVELNVQDRLCFFVEKRSMWEAIIAAVPKQRVDPVEFCKRESTLDVLGRDYMPYEEIATCCADKGVENTENVEEILKLSGYAQVKPWTHTLERASIDLNLLHTFLRHLRRVITSLRSGRSLTLVQRFANVGLKEDLQRLRKTSVATLDILEFIWSFADVDDAPETRGFKVGDEVVCLFGNAIVRLGRIASVAGNNLYSVRYRDGDVENNLDEDKVKAYTNRGRYYQNDVVICTWGAQQQYYKARITAVNPSPVNPQSYNVLFDDGDFEADVPPMRIRRIEELPPLQHKNLPNWQKKFIPQLIDLMQYKMLIHPWYRKATASEHPFFVPEVSEEVPETKRINPDECICANFDFSQGGIPRGLFYRLAILAQSLLSEDATAELHLFNNFAEICIDSENTVYLLQTDWMVRLLVKTKEGDRGGSDAHRAFNVTTALLQKLNNDHFKAQRLHYCVWFSDAEGRKVSLKEAQAQRLKPWFALTESETRAELSTTKFL